MTRSYLWILLLISPVYADIDLDDLSGFWRITWNAGDKPVQSEFVMEKTSLTVPIAGWAASTYYRVDGLEKIFGAAVMEKDGVRRLVWFQNRKINHEDKRGLRLDTESNIILRVDPQELGLGGDVATEERAVMQPLVLEAVEGAR